MVELDECAVYHQVLRETPLASMRLFLRHKLTLAIGNKICVPGRDHNH